jgi:Arm DNA-binding domain
MHKLTALRVKNARPGERLSDGGGLRLDVDNGGRGAWIFRYVSPLTDRERYAGLGSLRDVSLAKAREAAAKARELLREGKDPIEHRNAQRAAAKADASRGVTFAAYAERFIAAREASWKNPVHRQQWRNTLRDYVHPILGQMPVVDVDTAAVLRVLQPIWNTKPETASRIRGRIESVLSAAKAEGLRVGENPALWRGHLDQLLPSKRKVRLVRHHAALPYAELPEFMGTLIQDASTAARLLRFIILTAARYSEAALATWAEIDLKEKVWCVPAVGRQHLSDRMS